MDKVIWYTAGGEEVDLSDMVNRYALEGMMGHLAPTYRFGTSNMPLGDGVKITQVRADATTVNVPLALKASSMSGLRALRRELAKALGPKEGDGRLRVVDDDGNGRELYARYKGGLERAVERWGWMRAELVFYGADPYWYEINERSVTVTSGGGFIPWFPMPPLRLMSSSVYGNVSVDNPGDVETWPVWSIVGPGEDPVLRNDTTGKELSLDVTLAVHDLLEIDTRPRQKTVTLNGVKRFDLVSGSLWALAAGTNEVAVNMAGATGESSVGFDFWARYGGA